MVQTTVFDTVKQLLEKGMTLEEAIREVEFKLRTPFPENIRDMIREECG